MATFDLGADIDEALGGTVQKASSAVGDAFEAAAQKWKVPASVLRGMYQVESSGGKRLKSPQGALGPMGLMPTLIKHYGVTDPNNLDQSADAAAQYLREGLNKYGGDLNKALQYYHGGPDETGWGPLTQQYPEQIYAASGPAPKATASFDPSSLDASLKDLSPQKNLSSPSPVGPVMAPAAATPWGHLANTANALLQGQGTKVEALGGALGAKIMGSPLSFGQNYQNELNAANEGRAQFQAQNPGTSVVEDIGGSAASAIPLMMAGGAGASAGADALATSAPRIAPLVQGLSKFLGGSAGAGADGIGGFLLRRASQAGAGALQGSAAAGLSSGLNTRDSVGEQLGVGAGVGAGINAAVAPVLQTALSPMAARLTPAVAQMAQRLQGLGVNIPGWAMAPDQELRRMGEKLAPIGADLHSDWTRALGKTIGVDSPTLDQDTLLSARNAIGKRLDKAATGSDILWDGRLHDDLAAAHEGIVNNPLVPRNVRNLVGTLQGRIESRVLQHEGDKLGFTLPGEDYQTLMAKNGPIGQLLGSKDPYAQQAGQAYKNAFWEALDRNYSGHGDEWTAAKTQYKNLKVLEDVAAKAGPNGIPNPQSLLSAVTRHYPNYAKTGAGDIGDLAEGGKFLPPLNVQGDVKSSGHGVPLSLNSPLGWMAAAGLGTEAVHGGHEALQLAASHPLLTLAGITATGGRSAAKAIVGKHIASPEFTNALIARSLAAPETVRAPYGFINPLIPPAVGVENQ